MEKINYYLAEGTLLKKQYRIEKVLGQGGFAITYLASSNGKKVAIKELFYQEFQTRDITKSTEVLLSQADKEEQLLHLKARFLKAADLLRVSGMVKGIVSLLDSFEENGTLYNVMEYLQGTNMKEYIHEKEVFHLDQLFSKLKPIMHSLVKIHDMGVIHGDISPDNIIVSEDGKKFTMVDFGAFRVIGAPTIRDKLYKEGYTPCEMYSYDGEIGAWCDVYSMGATIYYGITGIRPQEAMFRMLYDELDWRMEEDRRYIDILKKMLQVDVDDRYNSFLRLLDDLNAIEQEEKKKIAQEKRNAKIMFGSGIGVGAVLGVMVAATVMESGSVPPSNQEQTKIESAVEESTTEEPIPEQSLDQKGPAAEETSQS